MKAGRIVRQARRRAGLSQRALAEATGVLQPQIARIESGAISPRLDTLERLLSATGWTLELSPRIGIGVDRSLIQAALAKTPEDRILAAGDAGRNLATFKEAARRGSRL